MQAMNQLWDEDDDSWASDAEFGVEFDTETFSRLQRNDPLVAGLIIDGSYWPKDAGRVIGNSDISHLEIAVNDVDYDYDDDSDDDDEPTVNGRRWLNELLHGLARNRSIDTIVLARTEEDYASYHQYDTSSPPRRKLDNFHILAPFFEHNCNLKRIVIEEFDMMLGIFNQLGSALSKCNNSRFRYFYLGGCIFEDQGAAEFIRSLEGVHTFTNLEFCGNTIVNMERGQLCCAIGYLLTNAMSNIVVLTISDTSSLDDMCIILLRNALMRNRTVTDLDLSGNVAISSNGWCAFSRVLSCPTCVIKSLALRNTQMDSEVIACLGQSLIFNTVLHDLNICNNPSITASGWRCFFEGLRSPDAALKRLTISRCNINNESAAVIATGLTQNSSLKDLDMDSNESITLAGWKSFFDTMLNWKHCCSLEKLTMPFPSDDNWNKELGENLCHHLCDKSSINSIYSSNHTLQCVRKSLSPELMSLFKLNENEDKAAVSSPREDYGASFWYGR